MNENEIKNIKMDELKENIVNKVRNLFGKAKDDLQIKGRLDILIQRDVPDILDSYGITNVDKNVHDVLRESLQTAYDLDKNLDEKENIFSGTLNYSIDSKREKIINTSNDDLRHEINDVNKELFSRYSEEKDKIDKKEKAEQDEYFTHEPEFKSRVRQVLERKGIQNEDVIYEIENRVKNTVGHIYEDYNEADKSISNNLEEICDEQLGKYEQEVTSSRQDVKTESKEKNDFTDFLHEEVNPEENIAENDIKNINNEGEPNKNIKRSLPDNILY